MTFLCNKHVCVVDRESCTTPPPKKWTIGGGAVLMSGSHNTWGSCHLCHHHHSSQLEGRTPAALPDSFYQWCWHPRRRAQWVCWSSWQSRHPFVVHVLVLPHLMWLASSPDPTIRAVEYSTDMECCLIREEDVMEPTSLDCGRLHGLSTSDSVVIVIIVQLMDHLHPVGMIFVLLQDVPDGFLWNSSLCHSPGNWCVVVMIECGNCQSLDVLRCCLAARSAPVQDADIVLELLVEAMYGLVTGWVLPMLCTESALS